MNHFNSDNQLLAPSENHPVVIGPPTRFSNRVARKVSIRKGHSLSERRAWSNMTLTVISGTCQLVMDNQQVDLNPNDTFQIPLHIDHKIIGLSDVRIIVAFDAFHPSDSA